MNLMKTRNLSFTGIAMAALLTATPAAAQVGGGIKAGINLATVQGFNDSTTSTWGAVIASTSPAPGATVLAWWNGVNWTVIGA